MSKKESNKKWYLANRDKILAKQKVRYEDNKVVILAQHKDYREKRKVDNPEYEVSKRRIAWERQLRKHGWTPEMYEEKSQEQEGKCAICRQPVEGRRLDADHEHTVPPVPRGLLCNKHNQMIGFSGDSIPILEAAIEYLKVYRSTHAKGIDCPSPTPR